MTAITPELLIFVYNVLYIVKYVMQRFHHVYQSHTLTYLKPMVYYTWWEQP